MSPLKAVMVLFMFGICLQVSSLQFVYPKFDNLDDFQHSGDSNAHMEALQVTRDTSNPTHSLENSTGRILYKDTFKLWREHGSVVASFNTSFLLNIVPRKGLGGEGLAFILTKDTELPSNSEGQWIGITNQTTNGSSNIVAIEFDTRKSYPEDIDDNHVGVDVNGMISIRQVSLYSYGIRLSNVSDVLVEIRYEGESGNMQIDVSMFNYTGSNHSKASIPLAINLSSYLPEDIYFGFSGSTGNLTQLNCIKSWNFTGSDIGKKSNRNFVWILLVVLFFIICIGLTFYLRRRREIRLRQRQFNLKMDLILGDSKKGPRKFQFKELKSATSNFDPKNKLGQGGFGTVYKGLLKKTHEEIAVKRVSKDSRQGEQEFMAEVTTISQLNHKNLVKLIGWCHQRNDLLLVYELMPNGSLDKLIFSKETTLAWTKRHKIIRGVAAALCYLHIGCKKRVLHRDVKASNVMLDADYEARLGDFGLARTVKNDGNTHYSTSLIAGTPGYIAPESFHTGRASPETDVYGFGAFSLEVACGRRPADLNNNNNLVDWLWNLYEKQVILEAADPQLNGEFDEQQMESVLILGLACCHPNPNERPSMSMAFQVLAGEAPAPSPPRERPKFMWPVMGTIEGEPVPSLFVDIELDVVD